jgi:hypothetical protein
MEDLPMSDLSQFRSVIKSVQTGDVAVTGNGTADDETISAVTIAKCLILVHGGIHATGNNTRAWLSSTTNLKIEAQSEGHDIQYQIIEFY